jgi:hypothetical protein
MDRVEQERQAYIAERQRERSAVYDPDANVTMPMDPLAAPTRPTFKKSWAGTYDLLKVVDYFFEQGYLNVKQRDAVRLFELQRYAEIKL